MAAVEGWWWWLSPGAVCFIFLNVVVGAIAVMSHWQGRRPSSPSRRSSSAVLDRLCTFSIFSIRSVDYNTALYLQPVPDSSLEPELPAASTVITEQGMSPCAPAPPSAATSIQEEDSSISLEEAYALAQLGRRSWTALTTARPRSAVKTETQREPEEGKEEVNARAEDFIRKFREQLKLQRLNSIFNYTQMLKRHGK